MARVNVQKVFRKVIEAGHYNPSKTFGEYFMCFALNKAATSEHISIDEYLSARAAIRRELEGYPTLCLFVKAKVEENWDLFRPKFFAENVGIKIYWNWYNRRRIYKDLQRKYSKESGE